MRLPATIWFRVRVEQNSPTAMKHPPSSSRARAPVATGFHSGGTVA